MRLALDMGACLGAAVAVIHGAPVTSGGAVAVAAVSGLAVLIGVDRFGRARSKVRLANWSSVSDLILIGVMMLWVSGLTYLLTGYSLVISYLLLM